MYYALSLIKQTYYLVTIPVEKEPALYVNGYVAGAVSAPAVPNNGFNRKGADELSGEGSTLITTVLFLTSNGNVTPVGALLKKSSPGTGGPGFKPLNPLKLSDESKTVKVPSKY